MPAHRLHLIATRRRGLLGTTALLPVALTLLLPQAAIAQTPTGGRVVGGTATIAQSPSTTQINQSTNRAAIDWQRFDVGARHAVVFNQPSSASWTLNRVTTPDPSVIAGRISANGGVAIVNQSGVVFAQGAQVNVGSLIASAASITTENFMNNRMVFDGAPRPGARVENHGTITVAERGLATLVAPGVANRGVIQARLGRVALAGAETFALDLAGDGLVRIDVTQAVRQAPDGSTALVTNSGVVEAQGGTVLLSAHAAQGLVETVVRNTGRVSANAGAGRPAGQVVLRGEGGGVQVAGVVEARGGATQQGGRVAVESLGGAVTVAPRARVDASGGAGGGTVQVGGRQTRTAQVDGAVLARGNGARARGGQVAVQAAEAVALGAGVQVDASGGAGGGTALIGTEGVGRRQVMATRTTVARGAVVRADATVAGDGGLIVVNSAERTEMLGTLSARGGPQGGNGGFVEVSGQGQFVAQGLLKAIDLSAPNGAAGTLLLDPRVIVISNAGGGTVAGDVAAGDNPPGTLTLLASGTGSVSDFALNLVLEASDTIRVADAVNKTAGGLTMRTTGNAGTPGIFVDTSLTVSGGALVLESAAGISITATGSITAATSLALSAATGISQNAASVITTPQLSAVSAAGDVTLAGAGNRIGTVAGSGTARFSLANDAGLTVATVGAIDGIAAGAVTLSVTPGNSLVVNRAIVANSGDITLTANTLTTGAAGTLTANAANRVVSLRADSITLGAAVTANATSGTIEIGPRNAATAFSPPSGTFNAATLRLGRTALGDRTDTVTADATTVSASLTKAGGGTLELAGGTLALEAPVTVLSGAAAGNTLDLLTTTGDVTQLSTAVLTAGALRANAARSVALATAMNEVGRVAGSAGSGQALRLRTEGTLTVDTVTTTLGASTGGITVTNGTVDLETRTAGSIGQTTIGVITAGSLRAVAVGAVEIATATNQVGTVAGAATGNFRLFNGQTLAVDAAGASTGIAAGAVTLSVTPGSSINVNQAIAATTGDITLTANTLTTGAAGTLEATAANRVVSLRADSVTLGAAVTANATSGTIEIGPRGEGTAFSPPSGDFIAATLRFGRTLQGDRVATGLTGATALLADATSLGMITAGPTTVSSALTKTGGGTLALVGSSVSLQAAATVETGVAPGNTLDLLATTGDIGQTAAAAIGAGLLIARAGGSVDLATATNMVGTGNLVTTVAGSAGNGQAFRLWNGQGLTVDSGIERSGTTVSGQTTAGNSVAGITVTGGTIDLQAVTGDITQTATGVLTAANLLARADAGSVLLADATNAVSTVAGSAGTGQTFRLLNGQTMNVGSVADASSTNIDGITVTNGTVDLETRTAGSIGQTTIGVITAGSLRAVAVGAVEIATATNQVGTVAGAATGNFRLFNGQTLAVDAAGASTGIAAGAVTLSVTPGSSINVNQAIAATTGDITLTANTLTTGAAGTLEATAANRVVSLRADSVTLGAAVTANATSGTIEIGPRGEGTAFSPPSGDFIAATLRFGRTLQGDRVATGLTGATALLADATSLGMITAGPTIVSSALTKTGGGTLALVGSSVSLQAAATVETGVAPGNTLDLLATTGDIGQTAAAAIGAGLLIARAGGSVDLATATNMVGTGNLVTTVAGSAGNGQAFRLWNGQGLTVDSGIERSGTTVSGQTTAGNTVAGIIAPGGTIDLQAATGDIGQTGPGLLTATNLLARADAGSVDFSDATNNISTLAGRAAIGENFLLRNGSSLSIGTVLDAASSPVSGIGAVSGTVDLGLVSGSLSQTADGVIETRQLRVVATSGAVELRSGVNAIDSLAGSAVGEFGLINSRSLTLDTVATRAGTSSGIAAVGGLADLQTLSGDLGQTGAGVVLASQFRALGGRSVLLDQAVNQVGTAAGMAGETFALRNGQSLVIDQARGTSGVQAGVRVALETTSGSLGQTGVGVVQAPQLDASSAGSVLLRDATNLVSSASGTAGDGQAFRLLNGQALTVGGVTARGGDADLQTTTGSINQTAAVTSSTLLARANSGGVDLTGATNMVSTAAGVATGDFRLLNGRQLTIGTASSVSGVQGNAVQVSTTDLIVGAAVTGTGGAVGLNATSGNVLQNAAASVVGAGGVQVSGSGAVTTQGLVQASNADVSLTSGGNMEQAAGKITAVSGNVSLVSGGNVLQNAGASVVGTGGVQVSGNGAVTTQGLVQASNADVSLTSGGNMVQAAGAITAVSGNVSLVSSGNVLQNAGASVVGAGGVQVSGSAAVTTQGLVQASNADVSLTSGGNMVQAAGAITAVSGNVSLVSGGNIQQGTNASVNGGTVTVRANGTAIQTGDARITADRLTIDAAGGAFFNADSPLAGVIANRIENVRADAGQAIIRLRGALSADRTIVTGTQNARDGYQMLADRDVQFSGATVAASAGSIDIRSATRLFVDEGTTMAAPQSVRLHSGQQTTVFGSIVSGDRIAVTAGTAGSAAGEVAVSKSRFTAGTAVLLAAGGSVTASDLTVVPGAGDRVPLVLFDVRRTPTALRDVPAAMTRDTADVPGLAGEQQRWQVASQDLAGSNSLLFGRDDGASGSASASPGGAATMFIDVGTGPLFLLLDGGTASGVIRAGRLGVHGLPGEQQIGNTLSVGLYGRLSGNAEGFAARFGRSTATQPDDQTRYRFNECVIGSVSCAVISRGQPLPVPILRELTLINREVLDADVVLPNVSAEDEREDN